MTYKENLIRFYSKIASYFHCHNVIGVLGKKLCVMSNVGVLECEVWVMDGYGMVESWVKHHVFLILV